MDPAVLDLRRSPRPRAGHILALRDVPATEQIVMPFHASPTVRLAPDRGIEWRVALAIGLVLAGYVLTLGLAFAAAWWLGVAAIILAAGMVLGGARGVVAIAGGHEVSAAAEPVLHRTVERLCQLDDRPMPRLVVVETPEANAFAAGWQGAGTIGVTRGLLRTLSPRELEAVLAHELGHLANRDAAVMAAASSLPVVAGLVAAFGVAMASIRSGGWIGLMIRFAGLVAAVFGVLCLVVSTLIVLALSRAREFAADRYAAELTGRPRALASALQTIARAPEGGSLRLAALSGLLFSAPGLPFLDCLATHPRPERRVARLVAFATALETGGAAEPASEAKGTGSSGSPRPTATPGTRLPSGAVGFIRSERPRRVSTAIMGAGLTGGAALGAVILALFLLGGGHNTATASTSPSSGSSAPTTSGPVARCTAGNGVTDPPVVTDALVTATAEEIRATFEWCDDTETYDATANLDLDGPTMRTLTRSMPAQFEPGVATVIFARDDYEAADLPGGTYRARLVLEDLDGLRSAARTFTLVVPEARSSVTDEPHSSPPPAPATSDSGFQSPTGNLRCEVAGFELRCLSLNDGFAVILPEYGEAEDSPGIQAAGGPTVPYGETWSHQPFECASQVDGITCRNGSDNGFFLNRDSFEVY